MSFALHRLTNTVYTITTAKHCSLTVAGSLHGFAASSIAFISHERKRVVIQFLSIHNIDVFYRRSYWSIHIIDVFYCRSYWSIHNIDVLYCRSYWSIHNIDVFYCRSYWSIHNIDVFTVAHIEVFTILTFCYCRSYWSIHNIDVFSKNMYWVIQTFNTAVIVLWTLSAVCESIVGITDGQVWIFVSHETLYASYVIFRLRFRSNQHYDAVRTYILIIYLICIICSYFNVTSLCH